MAVQSVENLRKQFFSIGFEKSLKNHYKNMLNWLNWSQKQRNHCINWLNWLNWSDFGTIGCEAARQPGSP